MAAVDIVIAVDAALTHAAKRRRKLTAVMLSGDDGRALERTVEALRRRGHHDVEVRIDPREGPMRLLAIEVAGPAGAR